MKDKDNAQREPGTEAAGHNWSTLRTLFVELLANRVVQA
jgi:hypothetical protein